MPRMKDRKPNQERAAAALAARQKCRANGTFKCGTQITVRSRGYHKLRSRLSETERVLQKRRARSHGRLSNCILGLGNRIQTEKLHYTAFQKSFGRSMKVRAVGSLMLKLRRKAERAGGEFRELNTRALKLSQYDHCTGTCTKKRLSERWHVLGDGSGVVQRDVNCRLPGRHRGSVAQTLDFA